jgi:hypothetical protein
MSDFLTRLAQRSLGEAALIAPRLPPLFEPLLDGIPEVPAAPVMVPGLAPRSRPAPPSRPSHSAEAIPQAVTHGKRRETRATPRPTQDTSPPPQHAEQVRSPATASDDHARHEPLVPAVQDTSPTHSDNPMFHFIHPSITAAQTESTTGATSPPLVPHPASKMGTATALPVTCLDLADDRPNAAPTVHITIGRVEVRARVSATPAAPRPRSESKPALSLSDYLKRGGGKP